MNKHTPGPWVYEVKGDTIFIGPCDSVYKGVAAIVATIEHHHAREPNARLISAAPDMIMALEQIAAWKDVVKVIAPELGGLLKSFYFAEHAISKAKGE
jgi:hypothetical protein